MDFLELMQKLKNLHKKAHRSSKIDLVDFIF